MALIGKIRGTGRVAEPAPPTPERAKGEAVERVSGSVQVRHVDAGSCNGCEIEIGQAFSPSMTPSGTGSGWWPPHATRMRWW